MVSYLVSVDLLSKACVHSNNELSVTVKLVLLLKADGLLMLPIPAIVNTVLPAVSMTS